MKWWCVMLSNKRRTEKRTCLRNVITHFSHFIEMNEKPRDRLINLIKCLLMRLRNPSLISRDVFEWYAQFQFILVSAQTWWFCCMQSICHFYLDVCVCWCDRESERERLWMYTCMYGYTRVCTTTASVSVNGRANKQNQIKTFISYGENKINHDQRRI